MENNWFFVNRVYKALLPLLRAAPFPDSDIKPMQAGGQLLRAYFDEFGFDTILIEGLVIYEQLIGIHSFLYHWSCTAGFHCPLC